MRVRARSELPFDQDASGRFLPVIIALMVYLASLALVGAMVLSESISRWSGDLSASITVQIAPVSGDGDDGAVERVLEVLRSVEGVARARALSVTELRGLLEPWIGSGGRVEDLPLPRLIDVTLEPGKRIDLDRLAESLAAAAPEVSLDDHSLWLDSLLRLGRSIRLVAAAVVLFIGAAAVAVVVFTTRAGLAVRRDAIEIMHVIGACDSYVADQFQRHTLMLGLRGGAIGLGLALATLFGLQQLVRGVEVPLMGVLGLAPATWVVLVVLPLAASLVATLTARVTVLRTLTRLP